MQCNDLLAECDAHLADMRQDVIANWSQLRSEHSFLAIYATYPDFAKDCSWEKLYKKPLYAELLSAATPSNSMIQLVAILVFASKLRTIIRFMYSHYKHYAIVEDTWMIIVMEFLKYVYSLRPPFPEPEEIFKKIRTKTGNQLRKFLRDTKRSHDREDELFAEKAFKESSEQIMSYHDIVNALKNRLKEDEYDALFDRIKYEFYDRHKKLRDFKVGRNAPAERRAVKKSKRTLKVYFKRLGICPAGLKHHESK